MIKLGSTSYKQTKFGILPREKVLEMEVLGTKKGLLFLNKTIKINNKLTFEFIKEIHKRGFSDILMEESGKFRTVQVTYSGNEAPHFSKIPELIKNLCDDTEFTLSELPKPDEEGYIERVVELLAQFQHRFVFIHPFIDYNGRTSRMFTSYLLMRLNLPIIEIKTEQEKQRKAYIKALQKADGGDYFELEEIISITLNESLKEIIK